MLRVAAMQRLLRCCFCCVYYDSLVKTSVALRSRCSSMIIRRRFSRFPAEISDTTSYTKTLDVLHAPTVHHRTSHTACAVPVGEGQRVIVCQWSP